MVFSFIEIFGQVSMNQTGRTLTIDDSMVHSAGNDQFENIRHLNGLCEQSFRFVVCTYALALWWPKLKIVVKNEANHQ